jgi:pyruvate kinase
MIIATLPSLHRKALVERIINHPLIGGVRYNVGTRSSYSPKETLETIYARTEKAGKKFWVDLKGRQLRIVRWADPTYGDIVLNHDIEVDLPARIFFRGNEWSTIVDVQGNRVFVDPDPQSAVGAGQAVNVIGDNLKILGYLTEQDERYLEAAKKLGIEDIMLSFVEESGDISEVLIIHPLAQCILKIESLPGLNFVKKLYSMRGYNSWPHATICSSISEKTKRRLFRLWRSSLKKIPKPSLLRIYLNHCVVKDTWL